MFIIIGNKRKNPLQINNMFNICVVNSDSGASLLAGAVFFVLWECRSYVNGNSQILLVISENKRNIVLMRNIVETSIELKYKKV